MAEKPTINNLFTPILKLKEDAQKAMSQPRVTDLYSTGDDLIDEYIGGGIGRKDGRYEIVLIFGDTGCIDGEANIKFKSQYVKTPHDIKLKNLYRRFHNIPYTGWHSGHCDEKILVRAKSDGNLPQWVEVEDVLDKGVKNVIKVTAGDESVIATPDHRFYTENGWQELKDLSVGDKVLKASFKTKSMGGKKHIKNHIVYTKYHPSNRFKYVGGKYKYYVGMEHRLAYEAYKNGMEYDDYIKLLNNYDGRELWSIPNGMEIHHIDGDHSNNNIDNLELLDKVEHSRRGVESSLRNLDYGDKFEEITKIEVAGSCRVYDISCKDIHNFVANGFIVHNCNKSTFATQLAVTAALGGAQVAYYSLEDEKVDLCTRIIRQLRGMRANKFEDEMKLFDKISPFFSIAPADDGYTLEMLAKQVENLFLTGTDIVVIDPLQFVFEASVVERAETEFNRQRLFMRQINNLMKKSCEMTGKSKTLILVSHTNKGKFDDPIDTIMGSGANKQVPTKIIQVCREDNVRFLNLVKTRFTKYRVGRHQVSLDEDTMLIRTSSLPSDPKARQELIKDIRAGWDKKEK